MSLIRFIAVIQQRLNDVPQEKSELLVGNRRIAVRIEKPIGVVIHCPWITSTALPYCQSLAVGHSADTVFQNPPILWVKGLDFLMSYRIDIQSENPPT